MVIIHPIKGVFHITRFYANFDASLQVFLVELLRRLSEKYSSRWFLLGDFNELFNHSEKLEDCEWPQVQIDRYL